MYISLRLKQNSFMVWFFSFLSVSKEHQLFVKIQTLEVTKYSINSQEQNKSPTAYLPSQSRS